MIIKWGVKNFKSILEADLDLAPLTVFTGVNSSGKSAFLQSIAMLTQAVRNKDNGIIKLKGDLIDLGTFDLVYHKNSAENKEPHMGVIGINYVIQSNEYEYARLELGLYDNRKGNKKSSEYQWHEDIKNLKNPIEKIKDIIETDTINSKDVFVLLGELLKIDDIKYSISKKYNNTGSQTLSIKQELMECKKTGDKDPKCLKIGYGTSESFDEIRQKIESGEDYNTILTEICNVDFKDSSFIPSRICYRPYEKLHHYLDRCKDSAISGFAKILSDIPDEKLTTKEDAEKYYKEKIFDDYGRDETEVFLFYLCTNNHKMVEDEEINEETAMFNMIPGLRDLFDKRNFVKKFDTTGIEYFDIEFSDWYQVMSEQDKNTKEAITKELKNFEGFAGSLLNKIDDLKNKIEVLDNIPWLDSARKHLHNYFLNNIKYLGPLREDPKWFYNKRNKKDPQEFLDLGWLIRPSDSPLDSEYYSVIDDFGAKGENTSSVIANKTQEDHKIENYYSPAFFETPDYKMQKDKNIKFGLEEWLAYIGISDEIIIAERFGGIGDTSIIIVLNGQKYFLSQLGTGVSQVLPVLAMCLAAPVGSTLIIQEPEKNLHPKMQSRLADFFIAMALSGRQCLIETHSEYIINKIRYMKVEKDEQINAKIYFAEKKDGKTEFEEIEINEYGKIENWPDNFFDENTKWAVNINKAAFKKREKKNKEQ